MRLVAQQRWVWCPLVMVSSSPLLSKSDFYALGHGIQRQRWVPAAGLKIPGLPSTRAEASLHRSAGSS